MPEKPDQNPYAAPQVVAAARTVAPPRSGRMAMHSVFFLLRGVGFGFATLIGLVYSSGTVIHWENAGPILSGVFIGFAGMHWFDLRLATSKSTACMFAVAAYFIGAAVVTAAGYLRYFPTPF